MVSDEVTTTPPTVDLHPDRLWSRLADGAASVGTFDPADLDGLPDAAARYLRRALTPGVALTDTIELRMDGAIRLRSWMQFRARQILRAGAGFVWRPTVGRMPFRVSGFDAFAAGRAELRFGLWGAVAVARDSGPDVDRSAIGRLALETAAWVPQALTPRAGAAWRDGDDQRATVSLDIAGENTDVEIEVDVDGHLRSLVARRWGAPEGHEAGWYPFGGAIDHYATFNGVTIAGRGRVGWFWDGPGWHDGMFFRFRVTGARYLGAASTPETSDHRQHPAG